MNIAQVGKVRLGFRGLTNNDALLLLIGILLLATGLLVLWQQWPALP